MPWDELLIRGDARAEPARVPVSSLTADDSFVSRLGSMGFEMPGQRSTTTMVMELFDKSSTLKALMTYVTGQHSKMLYQAPRGSDPTWATLVKMAASSRPGDSALSRVASLLWAVGEAYYLLAVSGGELTVRGLSCLEVRERKGSPTMVVVDGVERKLGADESLHYVRRQHPLDSSRGAWSQANASRDIFAWFAAVAIADLAIETSRASAGVIYISDDSYVFPFAQGIDARVGGKDLMRVVTNWLVTPAKDPRSPAAVAPLVIYGPKADKAIVSTTINSRVPATREMREAKLDELALQIDLPPRRITGERGTYSNDWVMSTEEVNRYFLPYAESAAAGLRDPLGAVYSSITKKPLPEDFYIKANGRRFQFGPDYLTLIFTLMSEGLIDTGVGMDEIGAYDLWNGQDNPEPKNYQLRSVAGRRWSDRTIPNVPSRSRGSSLVQRQDEILDVDEVLELGQ